MAFKLNDSIFCLNQGNYHFAKIISVKDTDSQPKYLVHFYGWARRYDCWIYEEDATREPPTNFSFTIGDKVMCANRIGKIVGLYEEVGLPKYLVQFSSKPAQIPENELTKIPG